jgi:hypothetical protein
MGSPAGGSPFKQQPFGAPAKGGQAPFGQAAAEPAGVAGFEMGLPPPAPGRNNKNLIIAAVAAGAVLLVVILVVVLASGGKKKDDVVVPPPVENEDTAPEGDEAAEVKPPEPTGMATVQLVVEPKDATVTVNGTPLSGESPFLVPDVDRRWPMRLKVTKSGYKTFEKEVTVTGSKMKLPITLEPGGAEVAPPEPPPPVKDTTPPAETTPKPKKPKPPKPKGDLLAPTF